jgi:ABC-type multidrug transport system fused ATPase/permease subunit
MGKKFNVVSICLILVLGLRLMAHAEPALASESFGSLVVFLLYLFPFIGVILRKKWGPAVSGIVGILDSVMTLAYIGGLNVLGPVLADAALVFLSWMDYRQIAGKEKAAMATGSSEAIRGGASSDPG